MLIPAIVVVAYDRKQSLSRLLNSLKAAEYEYQNIPLIISIDQNDKEEVAELAKLFEWPHGEKKVIERESHLGLKGHVLTCGDLVEEYDAIIMLEDDLLVGKYFYDYALKAINYYQNEKAIAGISLYSYEFAESRFCPFIPVEDGTDVYFMQVASSWGQCWTKDQWQAFRKWFAENNEIKKRDLLPHYVRNWSKSSWKKHYIKYLIDQNKYFVFSRKSHTTNFNDAGTNADSENLFQVELALNKQADYRFVAFEDSHAVYDAYFEITPESLNHYTPELSDYEYNVDLYGVKDKDFLKGDYVLTTRNGDAPLKSYGLKMSPNVLNIIFKTEGQDIRLVKTENLDFSEQPAHKYYYRTSAIEKYIYDDVISKESFKKAEVLADEWAEERAKVMAPALADEIATEKVQKWIADKQFNEQYPKISIIIPLVSKSEKIGDTVQSILSQDYPNFEMAVVGNEGLFEDWDEKGRIQYIGNESGGYFDSLQKGFEATNGIIMGWIDPGAIYHSNAFIAVSKVFKRFPEVNWLTGFPADLTDNGVVIDTKKFSEYRWNKQGILNVDAGKLGEKINHNRIFWRRTLWNQTGGALNADFKATADLELWQRFNDADELYTVLTYLGSGPGKSTLLYNVNGYNEEIKQLNQQRMEKVARSNLIRKASHNFLKACFQRDIPLLRFIYLENNPHPPLIRYDHDEGTFFMSRY